jgi:indoleamine 2,3-dioxygenase
MIPMTLSQFDIDAHRGFLPSEDPIAILSEYFSPWEEFIHDLPKRLISGDVRRWLSRLPRLDTELLTSRPMQDRAMLILSYLGHAWVWGEPQALDFIPENIAVPWHGVAAKLGRPPVLSYASHALVNWKRLDLEHGIELNNISRLANFLGGQDEEWFVLIHISIEAHAGPAIQACVKLQQALASEDVPTVINSLSTIAGVAKILVSILERMIEKCDPYIYYNRVRSFIFGWAGNPALPNGVRYEGVSQWKGAGQKFRGETGAQSSIIPSLDAALSIRFDENNAFSQHLLELRSYMPPLHRSFVEALETNDSKLSCREFVLAKKDALMVEAYNDAVQEIYKFRALHLKLAGLYIAKQQAIAASNPTGTGTGGTPFLSYLNDHAEKTLILKL